MLAMSPVNAVEPEAPVLERDNKPPDDKPVAVEEIVVAVPVVKEFEAMVKSLLVVSHPKPEDSEVMAEAPLKKAIWPEVPDPDIPPPVPTQLARVSKQTVSVVAAPRFGKVKVWSPTVKSAVVIVAVKPLAVPVVCGLMAIRSLPDVVEPKMAELVVVSVAANAPED